MRKLLVSLFVVSIVVLGLVGGFALAGSSPPPDGPPAVADTQVPSMSEDLGIGEQLVLVVGGVFETRDEAVAATAGIDLGDVQGYYPVPVAQFEGLREVYPAGDWALVSAFRTQEGAEEFAAFVRSHGEPALVTTRVRGLGGFYAGLGQEARPDGLGPLQGPIPASLEAAP